MSDHDNDNDNTKPEHQSQIEWHPEDVTILNPGDKGYVYGDYDEEDGDESATASIEENLRKLTRADAPTC